MHRLSRCFTAVFSLWFAIVLGDPGVLHSCAMHGRGGMHASHAGGVAAGASTLAAHAGMAHHGMAHERAPADASHGKTPVPCTCLGHCCATTATALAHTAPAIERPSFDVPHRAPSASPVVAVAGAPEHSLPFAIGPPAV